MSCEQEARDMLEKMGIPCAQDYASSDLVWLANLINTASHNANRLSFLQQWLSCKGDVSFEETKRYGTRFMFRDLHGSLCHSAPTLVELIDRASHNTRAE